jgi:hypothetical protein
VIRYRVTNACGKRFIQKVELAIACASRESTSSAITTTSGYGTFKSIRWALV